MSIKVPSVKPFWDESGPAPDFRTWKLLFDGWLRLQDVGRETPLNDDQKNNMLLLHLGSEGLKVFQTNPILPTIAATAYAVFSQAVKGAFYIAPNPVRAHFDLCHRHQSAPETVAEYLSALRLVSSDCHFCTSCTKLILATMLVVGCNNKEAQERLLTEKQIDFDRFYSILQAEESAREASSHLQSGTSSAVRKVSQFSYGRAPKPSSYKSVKSDKGDKDECQTLKYQCKFCSGFHAPKRDVCPARGKKCSACGKEGNFAKACRSKEKSSLKVSSIKKSINSVSKGQPRDAFVTPVTFSHNGTSVHVSVEVDTASDVSTMTLSTYRGMFGSIPLPKVPEAVKLSNYDQSPITVLGIVEVEVSACDRSGKLSCYVMPDSHSPVLGKDAIRLLHLHIDPITFKVSAVKEQGIKEQEEQKYPNYQHAITLKEGSKPKVSKLRTVPLAFRELVAAEIQRMVDDDIWEPCEKSEYVHGMVIIPKPQAGQIRITTDLSPLNKDIVANHYPLPTAEDLFLRFRSCKIFSRLDLTKAYFHIELAPESRDLTATITPQGIYRYKRLLMGMTDSGSVFQSRIDDTLKGIDRVAASIDDILIGGVDRTDHDDRLKRVLQCLSDKDFRVNVDKCEFHKEELTYLGQIINSKILAESKLSKRLLHQSKAELCSFLGFVNFYNSAVPYLAQLCEPLRRLTRKDEKFEWSDKCQSNYDAIKETRSSVTLKAIFDPTAQTVLATDASEAGIGADLLQVQSGVEVLVSCASRTLQAAERNYATNEAEALACVWGCERFEKFLLGRHFTLRTHHSALTVLLQRYGTTRKAKKFYRWVERLQQFDYEVEYRKGSNNVLAHALSRLPLPSQSTVSTPDSIKALQATAGITFKELAEATANDDNLVSLMKFFKDNGQKFDKSKNPSMQALANILHDSYELKGVVYRSDGRIVLPGSLIRGILEESQKGHPGIARMKRALRTIYWWPGMSTEIERHVKFCQACQMSAKSAGPTPRVDGSFPEPTKPFQKLSIDITGPFQTQGFILAMVDHYSNYPFYTLTSKITTDVVIRFLETVFAQYGYPDCLLSDNGPQFRNEQLDNYLKNKGITHNLSPVYSPQTNGRIDCFNRYIKHGVQTFADRSGWEAKVRELMQAYRAIPLTDNGKSPSELLHGWPMRLPYRPPKPVVSATPPASTAGPPKKEEKKRPSKLATRGPYKVGQKVLAKRPQVLKGQSPWSSPKKVVEVLGNWTYKLSDGNVWNARRLRRFREAGIDDSDETATHAPQDNAQPVPLRRSSRVKRPVERYQS